MPTSDEWRVVSQVVVPKQYQMEVIHLAYEALVTCHLGTNKTYQSL